jgi:predicted alpha/beta superfamily hydrolase
VDIKKMRLSMLVRPVIVLFGLVGLVAACEAPPPPMLEGETAITIGTSIPLESEALGETRIINIHLPMSYDARNADYPVLYLIDGGVQQDFLPVAGFGALAWLSGQYEEFIVVGVQTNNRRYELTTPSTIAYDLRQIPNNGGADLYRRFIVEEVQPLIDARYRTTGETAVLGESLAGFFIVDTFLRAPESFDHYIAVSPSVWWEEKALTLSASTFLQAENFPNDRSLYLASADEADILDGIEPLVQALEVSAPTTLSWWYEPMPDEHHNTVYHPATLNALRLIFENDAH